VEAMGFDINTAPRTLKYEYNGMILECKQEKTFQLPIKIFARISVTAQSTL
jgi:hypothetical protein